MKRFKLSLQLYPPFFLLSMLAIGIVVFTISHTYKSFYYNETEKNLLDKARLLEGQFAALIASNKQDEIKKLSADFGSRSNTRVTVVLTDGTVIGESNLKAESMDNHAKREEIWKALSGKVGKSVRYSSTLEKSYFYLAVPLIYKENLIGVLRTSVSIDSVENHLDQIYKQMLKLALALAFVVGIIIWVLARWLSRPLERFRDQAEKYIQGDFSKKVTL